MRSSASAIKLAPFRRLSTASHYFLATNRNKSSVALDARTREGQEILRKLALKCDVVLENFRPGVRERLGLGYEKLRAQKPGIILCSISGFGTTGAMRDKPSFDLVTQAPFLRIVTSRRGPIRRRCSLSICARCWVR